jgi:two-component system response regulator PilR (NtrC family)
MTLAARGYDVESAARSKRPGRCCNNVAPAPFSSSSPTCGCPDGNGLDLLRRIDEAGRREKAIVITAYGSPENAVEALQGPGAYDYLTKPVDLRQFRAVVASALGRMPGRVRRCPVPRLACQRHTSAGGHASLERIVGESGAMQQVRSMVERVARSMAPVLVHGESGTGKELVARAIHDVSPRAGCPSSRSTAGPSPRP